MHPTFLRVACLFHYFTYSHPPLEIGFLWSSIPSEIMEQIIVLFFYTNDLHNTKTEKINRQAYNRPLPDI